MKTFNVKRKNIRKTLRTVVQLALILAVLVVFLKPVVFPKTYRQAAAGTSQPGTARKGFDGFVALSYLGVQESDTRERVVQARGNLDKHLQALSNSGFATVGFGEVLDYYENGKALPQRSLMLLFEDALKKTASLVQPSLERLNYKASMWTYADTLSQAGSRHLSGNDIKALEKSSFWEVGASGYRLSFINVFDRYGNYVGELNTDEYAQARTFLDRRYNHYLMDFLRDEDEVPYENNIQMAARIEGDYRLMTEGFEQEVGALPLAHALMHANTGKFGTHELVSTENERHIKDNFRLNFNREGYAKNTRDHSQYDLSRMQPSAVWPVNHLLMRLELETGMEMAYLQGNAAQASQFDQLHGRAEFDGDILYLTGDDQTFGLLRLKTPITGGLDIQATLLGNVYGSQLFYLNADVNKNNALIVGVVNNHLVVRQLASGTENELYAVSLSTLEPDNIISVEEDRHQVELGVLDAIIRYDSNPDRVAEARQRRQTVQAQQPATVAQGAEPYTPPVDQLQRGDRRLRLTFDGGSLHAWVDGQKLVDNLTVPAATGSYLMIESRPILPEHNQRNIYDPVYDSIFKGLVVKGLGSTAGTTYFSNGYNAFEQVLKGVKDVWSSINAWFISNL
jgi:hypothetical protein